jgi:hypothetical protein
MKECNQYGKSRRTTMDLSAYFQTIQYTLVGAIFVSLVLIFLYAYYGREEDKEED